MLVVIIGSLSKCAFEKCTLSGSVEPLSLSIFHSISKFVLLIDFSLNSTNNLGKITA